MALRFSIMRPIARTSTRPNPIANIWHATPKNPVEMVVSHSIDIMKVLNLPWLLAFRTFNGTIGTKDMPFPFNVGPVKKWVVDSDLGLQANRFRNTIPTLNKHVKYMKVEMAPPSLMEIFKAPGELRSVWRTWRSGAWKDIKVETAWVNFLIFVEILLWFFVGEVIGRGSILGYKLTAKDKRVVIDENGNAKTETYLRVRFPGERVHNNWGKQLVGVDWSEDNKITYDDLFWTGKYIPVGGNLGGMIEKVWNGVCCGNMNAFDNFM